MLSPKEIEHIKALLLSPDGSNVALAVALLQEYPAAVKALSIPLEIALTYSEHKTLVSDLLQQQSPSIHWQRLPLYAFSKTIAAPRVQQEHHQTIRLFIQQEPQYRPYLLDDTDKILLYVDGANFISLEPIFVATAHVFYAFALEHLPPDSYLYYNYADLLCQHPPAGQSLQDYQPQIIAYYEKAYQLKKETHILTRLARFYTDDLKDISNARSTWQYCLQEHPQYTDAYVALAELEVAQQEWQTAKKLLGQALQLSATGVWTNLDQVYYLLGNIAWKGEKKSTQASSYYEKSLDENCYFAAPLEALLALSLATKNYPKAIQWHRIALNLQPMNLSLQLQLAKLYQQTENYEKSAECYREILDIHPDFSPAVEGLKQLDGF